MADCDRDRKWRLIGNVDQLRNRPCRLLQSVTSSSTGEGNKLVLVFVARLDKFYVLDGECGHMGGPLYKGEIEECNGRTRLACPWHGYAFDVETGMSDIGLPQTTYEVKVEDCNLYVMHTSEISIQ